MEENKQKNILVTGGAGFIGSHLCKVLLDIGHNVICLDNLFTGAKKNISDLIDNQNFEFVNHDITKAYHRENIDEIYNLACPASPIHYQFNPIKTAKTSFIGTYNMLGLAKRVGARILFASTSEVYGNPEIHPQSEKYNGNVNPIGIRSCYDEGKRVAESLCFDYMRMHDVDIRIARIFNTYGPRMKIDDGRVLPTFIKQAALNKDLTVNGDGTQTRSFCFIDDLIDGILMLMNSEYSYPINIGNDDEVTINEIASTLISILNSESKIIYNELPEDDPLKRKPDLTLAKKILNWKPKIDKKDGFEMLIEYYKKNNLI